MRDHSKHILDWFHVTMRMTVLRQFAKGLVNSDSEEGEQVKKRFRMYTYIENNSHLIPNYGERYRYGEVITISFVESTVNEIVTKLMVKKQQMQWTPEGAHYLLQARTATLNGDLSGYFEKWYSGLKINDKVKIQHSSIKKVA